MTAFQTKQITFHEQLTKIRRLSPLVRPIFDGVRVDGIRPNSRR
jgi:hypothetical protein